MSLAGWLDTWRAVAAVAIAAAAGFEFVQADPAAPPGCAGTSAESPRSAPAACPRTVDSAAVHDDEGAVTITAAAAVALAQ